MEGGRYPKKLTYRPGSQPHKGRLNEDLGSGLDLPTKRVAVEEGLDGSDDELDTLPKSSQPNSSQPAHREKPELSDVLKNLKFKKKSAAEGNGETPTSKENAKRNADKRAGTDSSVTDKGNAVASSSTTRPLRDNVMTRNQSSDGRLGLKRNTDFPDKAVERPKPRPLLAKAQQPRLPISPSKSLSKLSAASRSSTDSLAPASGRKQEKQIRPTPCAFPAMSPLGDRKTAGKGRETGRQLQRKEPLAMDTEGRKGKGKGKEKLLDMPSLLSSPTKTKANFLPSPLGTPVGTPSRKQRLAPSEFPAPSPLRPDEQRKSSKRKPLPFPMDVYSQLEESPLSSPSKRRSSGSDDDERDRKRSRNLPVVLTESYDYEEDSELLFMAPGTDPKTLCPYCDTPLPTQPTPLLTRLLDETLPKSYRDARPSNPLGRKAPMGVFVGVCQRHRFESETLPEAEARGWPKFIDWPRLKGRVSTMERDLRRILADPGDPIVYGNDEEKEKRKNESPKNKGPRMRCIFWKDLLKELKSKGSKGVKGLQGQFANFEKTQPGYYGELGSVIIHQTLYDMFPLDTIDPELVNPLTPNEFIQRILVPEVGMRLVMEDMDLTLDDQSDKRRAVAVLRESASYGVAMFPEDGPESGGVSGKKHNGDNEEAMGLAEQIVMERARKRRKELEIEEKEEDELWRLQEEEAEEARKREKAEIAKQKRRAARQASKKAAEADLVGVEATPAPLRPRPRPVPKNKPVVTVVDSASDMDTGSSSHSGLFKSNSGIDSISSGVEELVPTPKARPRRTDNPPLDDAKLSDSDSDFPRQLHPAASSKPSRKSKKSRSTVATHASSEHEMESDAAIKESPPRARSPSASLTSSKRSTRGSSVVDLCSSSEDGGGSGILDSGKSRKVQALETPVPRRKYPKPSKLPDSSDEEEVEATPHPKHAPTSPPSVMSSSFRPLDVARARVPSRG
ncbi:RTC4-like domain-containing protein [Mycena sanguinolenta]|nr:RTC4-like domain-containing protein [Mycena sanguinolenta]